MNPSELELWHRRQEELVREVETGRLTRRPREEGSRESSSQTGIRGRRARLHRAIALWGGINVPFFRA
jgi:hypothetical protein